MKRVLLIAGMAIVLGACVIAEQGTPGEGFYGYFCATDSDCNAGLSCSAIGICLQATGVACHYNAQCASSICNTYYGICSINGARILSQEFNTLQAAGNDQPTGLWSDGTTMWVTDRTYSRPAKIYAYELRGL